MAKICPLSLLVGGLLAISGLCPLSAQEIERPRPWTPMEGRNSGSVGTCPDVDGGEGDTCYIVRCEPKLGLTFVIQHDGIAVEDVRAVRIVIGKHSEDVRLSDHGSDERIASFSAYPGLFKAMTSGRKWADLKTLEAGFEYSTTFELTGAKKLIGQIQRRCKH